MTTKEQGYAPTLRNKLAHKLLVGFQTETWKEQSVQAGATIRAQAKVGDKGQLVTVRPTNN